MPISVDGQPLINPLQVRVPASNVVPNQNVETTNATSPAGSNAPSSTAGTETTTFVSSSPDNQSPNDQRQDQQEQQEQQPTLNSTGPSQLINILV